MTAEEYIARIPVWTREKNSLEDVRRILDVLGNPDRRLSIIHVAGTNGKGSVCAYLTCALREAGYTVGTFVSPHLIEVRERFLLNGEPVEEALFEQAFHQVKAAVDEQIKKGLKHPSFFEFLFYMAALLFSRKNVDFWVMETGLGGRLDTTNVVERPLVSVITSISLEHTQYLGETLEEIAGEKAGIIKRRIPVVYDGNCTAAAKVIREKAKRMEAEAYCVCREDFSVRRADDGKIGLTISAADGMDTPELAIPFPALYQADNGALAWKTLQVLMDGKAVDPRRRPLLLSGMEKTVWPGRMEEILPGVYLDGAHNPGGIRAFAESAGNIPAARWLVLFGAVTDKAYEEMIACLCRKVKPDMAAIARIQNDRDLGTEGLEECFKRERCPVKRFERAGDAMEFLLAEKKEGDVVFCLGSLYLIGELRAYLRKVSPPGGGADGMRRKND